MLGGGPVAKTKEGGGVALAARVLGWRGGRWTLWWLASRDAQGGVSVSCRPGCGDRQSGRRRRRPAVDTATLWIRARCLSGHQHPRSKAAGILLSQHLLGRLATSLPRAEFHPHRPRRQAELPRLDAPGLGTAQASSPRGAGRIPRVLGHGLYDQGISIPVRGVHGEIAVFSATADVPRRQWLQLTKVCTGELQTIAAFLHQSVLKQCRIDIGDDGRALSKPEPSPTAPTSRTRAPMPPFARFIVRARWRDKGDLPKAWKRKLAATTEGNAGSIDERPPSAASGRPRALGWAGQPGCGGPEPQRSSPTSTRRTPRSSTACGTRWPVPASWGETCDQTPPTPDQVRGRLLTRQV